MSSIPTPEQIGTAWLTDRLREAGHPGVRVRAFTATRVGTGQIGKCIRYALELDGDPTAPRSLIGKFPSDDPTSRRPASCCGTSSRRCRSTGRSPDA